MGNTAPFMVMETAHLRPRGMPSNKHFHVLDRVDGDASHAHVARHAGVVAVVATVRGQVKCDREALLTSGEVAAVECVGGGSCRETCVLADGPGAHGIHRGLGAANEGLEARQGVGQWQLCRVGCCVKRLDRDALRRVPVQRRQITTRRRLGSGLGPLVQRSALKFRGVAHGVGLANLRLAWRVPLRRAA